MANELEKSYSCPECPWEDGCISDECRLLEWPNGAQVDKMLIQLDRDWRAGRLDNTPSFFEEVVTEEEVQSFLRRCRDEGLIKDQRRKLSNSEVVDALLFLPRGTTQGLGMTFRQYTGLLDPTQSGFRPLKVELEDAARWVNKKVQRLIKPQ